MTPREKAQQLLEQFESEIGHSDLTILPEMQLDLTEETKQLAREGALVVVEQVIESLSKATNIKAHFDFWDEVKKEIEKLVPAKFTGLGDDDSAKKN